eukprot:TRINITY_DN12836_c1_g1_i1.p1 TRINITY_DN12836_c1_g1~~TRINITY_DN12836_c1_g1_i1.p1  ORF type:complete len:100 (-),score=11.02 TRINITY_DN12836_c1_g1_i1:75-374(-)
MEKDDFIFLVTKPMLNICFKKFFCLFCFQFPHTITKRNIFQNPQHLAPNSKGTPQTLSNKISKQVDIQKEEEEREHNYPQILPLTNKWSPFQKQIKGSC